jgi:hypothetical protein
LKDTSVPPAAKCRITVKALKGRQEEMTEALNGITEQQPLESGNEALLQKK